MIKLISLLFIFSFFTQANNGVKVIYYNTQYVNLGLPCEQIDILDMPDEVMKYYLSEFTFNPKGQCVATIIYLGNLWNKRILFVNKVMEAEDSKVLVSAIVREVVITADSVVKLPEKAKTIMSLK
jgi:hypothetical protein